MAKATSFSRGQRGVYFLAVLTLFQLVGFILRAMLEIIIALLLSRDLKPLGLDFRQWQQWLPFLTALTHAVMAAVGIGVAMRWWRWLTSSSAEETPPYRPPIRYV